MRLADSDRIAAKVGRARRMERIVVFLGWFVVFLGVVAIAGAIVFYLSGDLKGDQAGGIVIGAMMATIVSGSALFANGINVGLGAERLELAARADVRATGEPTAGPAGTSPDGARREAGARS